MYKLTQKMPYAYGRCHFGLIFDVARVSLFFYRRKVEEAPSQILVKPSSLSHVWPLRFGGTGAFGILRDYCSGEGVGSDSLTQPNTRIRSRCEADLFHSIVWPEPNTPLKGVQESIVHLMNWWWFGSIISFTIIFSKQDAIWV